MADRAVAQSADLANRACPETPNWSEYRQMRFTVQEHDGQRVLLAEGQLDDNMLPRLRAALQTFDGDEIWLRSPGGNARVAREAGVLIRHSGVSTRIPAGWACYGACNYMFMGGVLRSVDPEGHFIAQLATPTDLAEVSPSERRALVAEIAQATALATSDDLDHLMHMGISRGLSEIIHAPARDGVTRRCLNQDEMRRYNLVNEAWTPPRPASEASD